MSAESLQPMAFVPSSASGFPACYGGWTPRAVIGATSIGGLLLPSADPTAAQVYAPRGVHVDADRVVVADTGNHRVLIFDGHPDHDGAEASVVLGQPNARTEGPQAGGRGPANGMNLPTGILIDDGRLVVADAWNHRILVWDRVPTTNDVPPDHVLGQVDDQSVDPNRGTGPSATSFYWPFGIAVVDGRFLVTDTGNRRVLVWNDGIPASADTAADLVLGQDSPDRREENRGGAVSAGSFRWPHAVAGDGRGGVLVADAGNHRALGWTAHPVHDRQADYVLGQPDLTTADDFPYRPQVGNVFRFPYGVMTLGSAADPGLAVADTANNRVLLWDAFPHDPETHPDYVLGQPGYSSNGENRWQSVDRDTLCWPYGLASFTSTDVEILAIADSGNNRVVLWERT
ncbi:MAG: NHL repeat-containing protein [Nocardioides sp.]|nr:NHL repeat-containing protein [Nocardioides sp.]